MTEARQRVVRHGTMLWPNDCPINISAVQRAAEQQATASVGPTPGSGVVPTAL
jgi:hypothetical protein